MKKPFKKIFFLALVLVAAAIGYGFYLFYKKPPDIRQESASYTFTADSIAAVYNQNENEANKKFLNQVLAIKGIISKIIIDSSKSQATIILSTNDPLTGITCSFYDSEAGSLKHLKQGDEVVVKGVCTGKLMDIVLNRCSIQH